MSIEWREPDSLGPPIDVRRLFFPERTALVELLSSLNTEQWQTPSPCPGWTVHELAVHLVHDDLRRLSAGRDGHVGAWVAAGSFEELVATLDEANEAWVAAVAPTLSPRMTIDMLSWLAEPTEAHLSSLAPDALAATVNWAGAGPHPNWLDVAREWTERWVHQQQIRQALARPGCDEPTYLETVVETFVRAVPLALPARPVGTQLQIHVPAPVERQWSFAATRGGWGFVPSPADVSTVVEIPAAALWRRAVRMLSREQVRASAHVTGDRDLAASLLDLRAAIVALTR